MKDSKRLLSLISICFSVLVVLTLILPIFTIIDGTGEGVVLTNINGIDILIKFFNLEYVGNLDYNIISVGYLLLLYLNIQFIVLAILKMCGKKISLKVLKVFTIANFGVLIAFLVSAGKIQMAGASTTDTGNIQWILSISVYIMIFSSIFNLISTFIKGTFEHTK